MSPTDCHSGLCKCQRQRRILELQTRASMRPEGRNFETLSHVPPSTVACSPYSGEHLVQILTSRGVAHDLLDLPPLLISGLAPMENVSEVHAQISELAPSNGSRN